MTSASSRGLSDPLPLEVIGRPGQQPADGPGFLGRAVRARLASAVHGRALITVMRPHSVLAFDREHWPSQVAELFAAVVVDQGRGQREQVALDDLVEVVERQADPMVGHAVLRESCRCGSAASDRPSRSVSGGSGRARCGLSPAIWSKSRLRRIRMALALFLCWLRSSRQLTTTPVGRWVIRTPLSVLFWCWPPGPARPHDVDLQVLGPDHDVDLLGLGQDGDGGGRGVDPALGLGLGHALDAVAAALELEVAKRPLAR